MTYKMPIVATAILRQLHRAADIGREQGKESDYVPEDGQAAAVVHQFAAK
jgi:hypothetical protein